jgi:hypothetical protein
MGIPRVTRWSCIGWTPPFNDCVLRFHFGRSAMKFCKGCHRDKLESEFGKHARTADGLDPRCKSCRNNRSKELYQQRMNDPNWCDTPAQKMCAKCKSVKPIEEFDVRRNVKDGHSPYCKSCKKLYHIARHKNGDLAGGIPGWTRLKNSAKARALEFSLSQEFFVAWWNTSEHKCHYCGATVEQFIHEKNAILSGNEKLSRFREVFSNPMHTKVVELSIDRKNPSLGYVESNIAKACWVCNYIKGGILSENEMMMIAPSIHNSILEVMRNGEL